MLHLPHMGENKTQIPRFTRLYLWAIACITLCLSMFLILTPSLITSLFFDINRESTSFFVRMLGSALLGYGVLNLMAARSATHRTCRVAVWANLSTLLIASIISIIYLESAIRFGWLIITQHLVFASGFCICAWQLRDTQTHE